MSENYPESITLEIPDTAMTATVEREKLHPAFGGGGGIGTQV